MTSTLRYDSEMPLESEADFPDLTHESQEIWDRNAQWWDARMGEGNQWHTLLIAPATEKLLAIRAGETVLEIACGNGQFARRLAYLGAQVVACDFSAAFLDCARLRTNEHSERIDYRRMDVTSLEHMAALGASRFDAAVCNMALMDIASITPLLQALRRALKPSGRFVFSVPHPCFNTNGTTMIAERDDFEDGGALSFSIRVKQYRTLAPRKGVGIPGQPLPHYYFNRTLSTLMQACFAAGFALDGLEEPVLQQGANEPYALRWENGTEIPPVLVARLRVT